MSILKTNNASITSTADEKLTEDNLKKRGYTSSYTYPDIYSYGSRYYIKFYNSLDPKLCIRYVRDSKQYNSFCVCGSIFSGSLWLDTLEDLIYLEVFWFSKNNIGEHIMDRIQQMQDNFNKNYYESTPF